ncbi:hypothetical protein [Photorhabdus laumondii]
MLQQHIRILLTDGQTSLNAALTEQSANRLGVKSSALLCPIKKQIT